MSLLSRASVVAVLLLSACASSQYPSMDEPMPLPEGGRSALKTGAATTNAATPATGRLERADVERVVDAGLGNFLTHVTLEPSLTAGKFTGWTIVGLQPPDLWRGVDLKLGDVVTRINGMPIERETEAFDAFQAVRQAPQLEVSYLRQNQAKTLRFTIVGAPSPALPRAPVAPSAAPSAPRSGG